MSNEDTAETAAESKEQERHNGNKVSSSKRKGSKEKIMIFNNSNNKEG